MKPPMMDNIESLIEELLREDCPVTLVVEPTDRSDEDEIFVAFISSREEKYNIILDKTGELYLRAFGASIKEAINKLNELCA